MICPKCLTELVGKPNFCTTCGFNILLHEHYKSKIDGENKWKNVKFVIIFYFVIFTTISLSAIYPSIAMSFLGNSIVDWLFLFVILLFLFIGRFEKKIIFSKFKIISSLNIVFLCLSVFLILNNLYHKYLFRIFNINLDKLLVDYTSTEHSIYFLIFYVCVMPAISEEIAFRVIILDKFRSVVSLKEAIILSSLLFAILHVNFYITPYYFLVGVILCWIRLYTKSLLPCILFHFLHNLYVVLEECQIL